ncbi:uncharacterized protein LOC142986007 [Anticarsia gemmatalis]|uniref:uncharacterized protein LOC142986007 n=1 Tax=Anticarsia gemmatalis TaxID=129554 RepID=UPI003F774B7D
MRALVDQGSQISIITEDAAQKLGLPRRHCKGVVFGLGAQQNNCKGALQITASAIQGEFTFNANVVIMKKLMHSLPNHTFEKPTWSYLKNINLADPEFHISRPIDLLLGAEVYSLIMMGGIIKGNNETEPVAQQTQLGWLLCGNVTTYQCNVVLNNLEDIERFWTIEDIADNPENLSAEDHYCVTQYQEQTTRQADGRYVVRYPMKPDYSEKIGDSKKRAIAQFLQLEKKLSKNHTLCNGYKSFINEYVYLGHMHSVNNDCNINSQASCYLPHHCVLRSDSTTTALRVVVNAYVIGL